MNTEWGQSPIVRLLDMKDQVVDALRHDPPVKWPLHIAGFLAAVQSIPPPLPTGAVFTALADVARALERLGDGQATGALCAMFAVDAPSAVTCRPEASCAQFQAGMDAWTADLDCGALVPAMQARRIAEYIEQHFAERITLAKLSRMSGWDARYLSRIFRSVRRVSIREYLEAVRIDQAAAWLRHGDKVESVVAAVGWRGRRNFFRHFKERMGLTPAEYRAAWIPR